MIDFVYANYADKSQGMYESWGKEAVEKMQAASRKYDLEESWRGKLKKSSVFLIGTRIISRTEWCSNIRIQVALKTSKECHLFVS